MTRPAPSKPPVSPLSGIRSHLHAAGLVTVCSTPSGVASYVIPDDGTAVTDVQMEQGRVVVKWTDDRFGTVWSVLDGGAVVEIACHDGGDAKAQRDAYRQACAEVDAENRENALEAVRAMVGAVWAEMGVEVEPAPEDAVQGQEDAIEGEAAGGSSGAT